MNRVSRNKIKWTPEMEDQLVNLRNCGVHKNEVAARLGVSIAAVDARYYRIKKEQSK